jgi:hypothetical protein
VGPVAAGGSTAAELTQRVRERLQTVFRGFELSVAVTEAVAVRIRVTGFVAEPGDRVLPGLLGAGDAGATMGQPLNFAAAVRLEPGVSLSPDCVAAEVVVGDRQMPPPLLRTVIEMTSATTARVRVQSQANIDEPVVHVQLGVGCSNRISRSYVVLADPPGTSVAPTPAPPVLALATSPQPIAAPEPAGVAPRAAAEPGSAQRLALAWRR